MDWLGTANDPSIVIRAKEAAASVIQTQILRLAWSV
jgi:hypothetical protein